MKVNHQPSTPVFCWPVGARKKTRKIVSTLMPTMASRRAMPSSAIFPRPIRTAIQIRPMTTTHPSSRTTTEPPATSV